MRIAEPCVSRRLSTHNVGCLLDFHLHSRADALETEPSNYRETFEWRIIKRLEDVQLRMSTTRLRRLVVLGRGPCRFRGWKSLLVEYCRSLSSSCDQSENVEADVEITITASTSAGFTGDSQEGTWSKSVMTSKLPDAVDLLDALVQQRCHLDNSLFYGVLKRCIEERDLVLGSKTHALAVRYGYESDKFLCNHIIRMYASHGRLEEALEVFSKVSEPDRYMWSSIILAHARQGQARRAIQLYRQMRQSKVMPDNHLFVSALKSCTAAVDLASGKAIHADIMQSAHKMNIFVGNSLVDMYAKCRSLEDARQVFDNLSGKNVVTWNTMIAGYVQQGLGQEVLNLFRDMQQEGATPPDVVTYTFLLKACGITASIDKGREIHAQLAKAGLDTTDFFVASALIDMYSKCGSMVDARKVFDVMPKRDVVTWNALIAGYTKLGEAQFVFHLFHSMKQEPIQPNDVTFLTVLTLCDHMGLVDKAQEYFALMVKDHGICPSIKHYNCMIDLLGRAGHLDKAAEVMRTMPFQPHGEAWRSLLGACRKWNNVVLGKKAFESAIRLNERDAAAYDLMSNIYETACMWEEAKEVQAMRIRAQAWKVPGHCWLPDKGGTTYMFGGKEEGGGEGRGGGEGGFEVVPWITRNQT